MLLRQAQPGRRPRPRRHGGLPCCGGRMPFVVGVHQTSAIGDPRPQQFGTSRQPPHRCAPLPSRGRLVDRFAESLEFADQPIAILRPRAAEPGGNRRPETRRRQQHDVVNPERRSSATSADHTNAVSGFPWTNTLGTRAPLTNERDRGHGDLCSSPLVESKPDRRRHRRVCKTSSLPNGLVAMEGRIRTRPCTRVIVSANAGRLVCGQCHQS